METTGNFLTQPNKDFPMDCETLDMLQSNAALVAALGNIAGDKLILRGCEASVDGSMRREGLVFVRTRAYPDGEVMKWLGGDTTGGMYVRTEHVGVSAMGVEYPKAYTRRVLAPGVGTENFDWNEFVKPLTQAEIGGLFVKTGESVSALERRISDEPLGVVKIWAGSKVPDGYALCDGRALRIEDYKELYAAIGTTFNGAMNYNGSENATQDGFFRLPDLRGRFVAGYSDVDNDYKGYGKAGGLKKVALEIGELPPHEHDFKDYYYAESQEKARGKFDIVETNGKTGSHSTDDDNNCLHYYEHKTKGVGGGESHENRPPYYVLAYIMKVKRG